jgi:hypothetical protein
VSGRRLLTALVAPAALLLSAAPAVVVFGRGWLPAGDPDVPVGTVVPPETTPLEWWVVFVLFYLAWMVGVTLLVVWSYDTLGRKWRSYDRPPRPARRTARRREAGLRYLEAQDEARAAAGKAAEAAEARKAAEAARGAPGAGPEGR